MNITSITITTDDGTTWTLTEPLPSLRIAINAEIEDMAPLLTPKSSKHAITTTNLFRFTAEGRWRHLERQEPSVGSEAIEEGQ